MKTATLTLLVAMVIGLVAAAPAAADMTITVSCSGGGLSSSQQFAIPCNAGVVNWGFTDPITIMADNGVTLGTINSMAVETCDEPYFNLHFSVKAGAADTTFNITSTSGPVTFSPLLNPFGYASAGVTLTSDADGATITGLFGGVGTTHLEEGKIYQARYNSTSVYANLVDGYSIGSDESVTHSDRQPGAGNDTILAAVSSIQSEFNFILSAEDQASGTSRFEVVDSFTPEPATLALLIVGGAGMLVARRRRTA